METTLETEDSNQSPRTPSVVEITDTFAPVSFRRAPKSSRWRSFLVGSKWTWTLTRIFILVLGFYIFWSHYFPIQITGPSMEPTYPDRSWNLINRTYYDPQHPPKRGDVVAIEARAGDVVYLKRIIGLPGERVGFFNNRVYINSEPLEEPYLVLKPKERRDAWTQRSVELGESEYFVVGDNRSMPMRHHTFGLTSRERILGKIVF